MKAIAVIPTYNEGGNIEALIRAILKADSGIHVVVVDDQSTDGTADVVKGLLPNEKRAHLIEKTTLRNGRAAADIMGMQYALKEGFDYIFQMDADFSHSPEYIPDFLQATAKNDVVIGSRLINGGGIVGRGAGRNIITAIANVYIRFVLGLKVRDCTSGYRCYKRNVLESIGLGGMMSTGPSLLEEILFACRKRGYRIHEIPIIFKDRVAGKSKLGAKELLNVFLTVLKIRLRR